MVSRKKSMCNKKKSNEISRVATSTVSFPCVHEGNRTHAWLETEHCIARSDFETDSGI